VFSMFSRGKISQDLMRDPRGLFRRGIFEDLCQHWIKKLVHPPKAYLSLLR
jgi:hypothetical protein